MKRRHLNTASDIALLLVAVLICAVLIRDFTRPRPVSNPNENSQGPQLQSTLHLQGIDFSRSDRTLLFVLSTQCPYCRASEPFYRELTSGLHGNKEPGNKNGGSKVQFAAAVSQPLPEAQAYLREAGLSFPQVVSAPPEALNVSGTPTLILADKKGKVLRYWVGKLPTEGEIRVMEALEGGS